MSYDVIDESDIPESHGRRYGMWSEIIKELATQPEGKALRFTYNPAENKTNIHGSLQAAAKKLKIRISVTLKDGVGYVKRKQDDDIKAA